MCDRIDLSDSGGGVLRADVAWRLLGGASARDALGPWVAARLGGGSCECGERRHDKPLELRVIARPLHEASLGHPHSPEEV